MSARRPRLRAAVLGLPIAVVLVVLGGSMLLLGPHLSDRANGVAALSYGAVAVLLLLLLLPAHLDPLPPSSPEVPASARRVRYLRIAAGAMAVGAVAAVIGFGVGVSEETVRGGITWRLLPAVTVLSALALARAVRRDVARHTLRVEGTVVVHDHARGPDEIELSRVAVVRAAPGPPPMIEVVAADGTVLLALHPEVFGATETDVIAWLEHHADVVRRPQV